MRFLARLLAHCEERPEKVALSFADGRSPITYGALENTIQKTMAYLQQLGVQPGDRVALQLPKCLPFIYLHLAVMRLGAISLPLNPAYPPDELAYFLGDAEVRLFFAEAGTETAVQQALADLPDVVCHLLTGHEAAFTALLTHTPHNLPPVPTDLHQTALMVYTSGTTGRPKGAEITHGNLTANLNSLHEAWGWRSDDILLHVLPIFHVHGLVVALHGALHAGAEAILLNKFEPSEALALLSQRKCTLFMAVPTIYRRLVEAPAMAAADLSHMRLFTSGSDRLPDDLFLAFQERFGHTLLERYGMTETGMNLSNPLHGERRVGSVGLPLPGVEARIAHPETDAPLPDGEIGEVQLRGANVFKGYWRQAEKTAAAFTADGWFRSGDLGVREADGYFTLKGRAKDLIISGGLNIYPPEVELVLADHPAVLACAVIGCPDAMWGERVTAVVVPQPGHTATPDDIIAYCRQHLAPYKTPKQVLFVAELPRNALGKVQKAELRRALCHEE